MHLQVVYSPVTFFGIELSCNRQLLCLRTREVCFQTLTESNRQMKLTLLRLQCNFAVQEELLKYVSEQEYNHLSSAEDVQFLFLIEPGLMK